MRLSGDTETCQAQHTGHNKHHHVARGLHLQSYVLSCPECLIFIAPELNTDTDVTHFTSPQMLRGLSLSLQVSLSLSLPRLV